MLLLLLLLRLLLRLLLLLLLLLQLLLLLLLLLPALRLMPRAPTRAPRRGSLRSTGCMGCIDATAAIDALSMSPCPVAKCTCCSSRSPRTCDRNQTGRPVADGLRLGQVAGHSS